MDKDGEQEGLYILMMSIHGLVRARDIELGRDADTGGQITYVIEMAKALAADPRVARVDLLTRRIEGPGIDPEYADVVEPIADKAQIIRVPCGPRRYLYKENLWPYMDEFVHHAMCHVRMVGRPPDVVHGHYADAGYAGSQLARELRVPFIFTGHSLGRVKKRRLQAKGQEEEALEKRYKFKRRFRAEEDALAAASLIVTSTTQEMNDQYSTYENYRTRHMRVIPPGVDLDRFRPPRRRDPVPPIKVEFARFLRDPDKPMILCLARPDERKNFRTLVQAYGRDQELQEMANLVLIAGTRDGITTLKPPERRVVLDIIQLIDEYDLYGRVAYPKRHLPTDVPDMYRLAATSRGVFVNPALTEPFGLTLIEAAASGLPVVATRDGGPLDIIAQCHNGLLIDPLDPDDLAGALKRILGEGQAWRLRATNGVVRANNLYTWANHVETYLSHVERLLDRPGPCLRIHDLSAADIGLPMGEGIRGLLERAVSRKRARRRALDSLVIGAEPAAKK
nr:glycosyltransferase [bacterium]